MTKNFYFNDAAVPQLVIDPHDNKVLDANLEACRLLRSDRRSLQQIKPSQLFAQSLSELLSFTQEVLAKVRGASSALSVVIDGEWRSVEVMGRCSYEDDGSLVHVSLQLVSELDARRERADASRHYRNGIGHWSRVAQIFREFEWENRLLLDAAGEGIYGVDQKGNTTFVNPAAQRILGYAVEELAGRNMHTMVHHSHCDGSHYHIDDCPIFAALHDGRVHSEENDVFWSKRGQPIDVEYTSTPIRDKGEIVGVVVVFRDVSEKKADRRQLLAALEEVKQLKDRLELENAYFQEEISSEYNHHRIIGKSAGVQQTIRQIELVAPTDATVLIYGESGTGKELIARSIHEGSQRSRRPLIRVNCAAVPDDLFESEFFGHVRGAFTGATSDRSGRFELADGGTLFLDEVAEIPLHLQGKLLRVLQEQQFERVGDVATRDVDVRIVAATNKDLRERVDTGQFREDLYFRLNVFPITSVPLRERKEDIPLLTQLFLEKAAVRAHKQDMKIPLAELSKLQRYHWPGNIRELENVIERLVIVTSGRVVQVDEGMLAHAKREQMTALPVPQRLECESDLKQRQRANIVRALKLSEGKVFGTGGAAELLGVKPTTLASRLKKLEIDARVYRRSR
ncbi:MAG: sigma 54-interacting transcriptional regulator [Pseudomonadota bacterium]